MRSTATNMTIIITWDPAVSPDDCGPVLSHTVTATSLADDTVRSPNRLNQTGAKFSDLINGINYTISVAAFNRAGTGPSSTINVTGNAIGKYAMFNVYL